MHEIADVEDLGADFGRGFDPLAVEVDVAAVSSRVAAPRAVRVHARDDVEDAFVEELAREGVVRVQEPVDEPFGEPFGHRLRGVLARRHPAHRSVLACFPELQEIDRVAVRRSAEHGGRHVGSGRGAGDQATVPFVVVGGKAREVEAVPGPGVTVMTSSPSSKVVGTRNHESRSAEPQAR